MDEMDDILKEFLLETNEGLENVDQDLITYEKNPDDRPLLDKIFRSIHTIKGGAGFLDLGHIESISHYAENILSKIRDGVLTLNNEIMNVILKSVDALKEIVVTVESSGSEGDTEYKELIIELKNIVEGVKPESATSPGEVKTISTSEKDSSKDKETETSADIMVEAKKEVPIETAEETVKETDITTPATEKESTPATETKKQPQVKRETSHADPNIRVQVGLLDKLMNLVGELVLSRNQIVQAAIDQPLLNTVTQRLSMITTELQENMMKTRMQPIGNVFNKFPRVVRDLAQSFNKEISLKIKGEDTELDRAILEGIADPLTHIIRNSIDHGIESSGERIKKGKSPSGSLLIQAFHEGGNVIVEIIDDGGGIDPEKIKEKALEKEVLPQKELDAMNDRDLINLVFHPGFSTAEKVTHVSGRGVGMDVVKTNAENIGGSIEIQSEVDQGTSIKLKIPLTLAIVQALVVRTDEHRFAIPQVSLVELVRLEGETQISKIEDVHGMKVYRLREKLLPLVDLKNLLDLPASKKETNDEDELINIVVLAAAEVQFGLIVDEILDTEEIVVKPVSKHLKQIECYSGSTIMGDGKAVLILDVIGLARAYEMGIDGSGKKMSAVLERSSSDVVEKNEFLVFNLVPNEQLAIPVQLVSRIEKTDSDKIEKFGETEVLQYSGKLLPVIRLEDYLNLTRPEGECEEVFVIVLHMDRDIGFIVRNITDTIDVGKNVDTKTVIQDCILGTTLFNEHTTLIIDTYKIIEKAHPEWFKKEVMDIGKGFSRGDVQILIAEDSPFFQNMERSYLESAGYKVLLANDGVEAFEMIGANSIDVLVTDIEMPRMNGFELAKKLRDDKRYENLPILAVTSLVGDAERERSKEVGINSYLVKLNKNDLLKGLDSILLSMKNGANGEESDVVEPGPMAEKRKTSDNDRRNNKRDMFADDDQRIGSDRRASNNYLVATFYIGNEFCGIDALQVQEILRYHEVTPVPLSSNDIEGLINLRGRILTVIDTRFKLNIDKSCWKEEPMSLVVFTDEEPVCLLVDEIGDIIEIERRLFEPPPKTFKGFDAHYISGVFKLEGRLLMMLNVEKLFG